MSFIVIIIVIVIVWFHVLYLQDIQGWECRNTSLKYDIHQLEKQKDKLSKLLRTLKKTSPVHGQPTHSQVLPTSVPVHHGTLQTITSQQDATHTITSHQKTSRTITSHQRAPHTITSHQGATHTRTSHSEAHSAIISHQGKSHTVTSHQEAPHIRTSHQRYPIS